MLGERAEWIRVPVGEDPARWNTRGDLLRVLLVVHNVTSATRLLDVLPLFRDDLRIQFLATCTNSSPFRGGLAELLAATGVPVLRWDQALATPVDLAITASLGGQLASIKGPVVTLSHGVGYNKKLATPDTGHRTPDTGHRTPDTGPVFGLSSEWLLDGGEPVVDVMVLSHPEQQERLDRYSPAGAPRGVLGGDPCFDRMLAARPYRERYRRALGVREGQRLLILNSTWNAESLFGDGPADEAGGGDILRDLLDRLAAQLPLDDYRLAAVLHPNIWHGHGPGQVRAWLDGACRGGLGLVDPLTDWRQAVIAADLVIGDFGSVSYYAAALGTPVLLGASGESRLDPHSPVAGFVRAAPRLDLAAPLLPQLDRACAQPPPPGPAELTTSHPGRSAPLLRSLFYELIGVAEPGHPALLDPLPLPGHQPPRHLAPVSVRTWRRPNSTVEVARYSAPPTRPPAGGVAHLAVHEDTLDPESLDLADLIFREGAPDDPLLGTPEEWTAEVLARHPHAALAARITGPGSCLVRLRDGEVLRLDGGPRGADPAACASALFGWLAEGGALAQLTAGGLTLATGGACHRVRVTRG